MKRGEGSGKGGAIYAKRLEALKGVISGLPRRGQVKKGRN